MNEHPTDARGQAAFTLLEMMVAVSVFAVIATLLYGTLARTVSSRAYAVEREETAARARAVLTWLGRDLSGSFQSSVYPSGNKVFFSSGIADTPATSDGDWLLDITGLSSRGTLNLDLGRLPPALPQRPVDQARILYRLEAPDPAIDHGPGFELVRYELRPPPREVDIETASRSVVADRIESISMRFLDGTTWHESWDAAQPGPLRGRAPRAVEIEVTVAAAGASSLSFVSAVEIPVAGSITSDGR